ncbi:MAG: energy-coupling factor ABC transporter substrate-binding protein [Methanobacterium sp.]|nr:energy-coupling factor ABC transporter substrate-binding protein [Methanobacterium sp.]
MVDKRPIILLSLVVIIVVLPLVIYNGLGEDQGYFGGSDDAGSTAVEETGYQPWFQSLWEPPSGEIESLLFASQAAIGALIIGYILGYLSGQAKAKRRENDENIGVNEKVKSSK